MTTPALIVARSLIKTRALTWSISTSTIALWSCVYVNIFWMIALWMRIRNTSENCNRSCKSHNYCEAENDWLLHNNIPLFVSGATFIVIIVCCLTVNVRFETEVTLSTDFFIFVVYAEILYSHSEDSEFHLLMGCHLQTHTWSCGCLLHSRDLDISVQLFLWLYPELLIENLQPSHMMQ